jgi:hypothetical protein
VPPIGRYVGKTLPRVQTEAMRLLGQHQGRTRQSVNDRVEQVKWLRLNPKLASLHGRRREQVVHQSSQCERTAVNGQEHLAHLRLAQRLEVCQQVVRDSCQIGDGFR